MAYVKYPKYYHEMRWEMREMAEQFTKNVLYRYPKARSFTASDVVHDMCGDSTGFPEWIATELRKMAERKTIIDHPTGPKRIVVRDKGPYGRTGRPQNLYRFAEAA